MLVAPRLKEIDLHTMNLDELRALVCRIEREMEVRRFEEGLRQALRDYQRRDPHVIRL